MTSQGPSADRRSLTEDVEFGPSDHSSALHLLSLGKSRATLQQPQSPQKQAKYPSIPSAITRAVEPRYDSPLATHGRRHKKRRMQEAQAAASTNFEQNQTVSSSSDAMNNTNEKNRKKSRSSRTEVANTLTDIGASIETTKDSIPDSTFSLSSSNSCTDKTVDHEPVSSHSKDIDKKNLNVSATIEQAQGSPSEQKTSPTPMPLKTLGQRRAGSRRHAALPLNRQKKLDVSNGTQNNSFESAGKVKKSRIGRNTNASKSSSQETATTNIEYVDNPTDQDILLGMRKFNSHPGNQVYRETVRKFQPQIKKKGRSEVAREIIDHIYNVIGGRFLKVDAVNRWQVMPDIDVMTKVAKAIVELRNKTSPIGKKIPKITEGVSVLESLKEGEKQSSTSRPKRKASLGRKVNDYVNESLTMSNQRKRRPKLPGSQKMITQKEAKPINRVIETERTLEEYIYNPDPNEYYVEETAYLYHDPPFPSEGKNGVTIEELRPIPPPPPLPSFPKSDTCLWSFDESARVLIADFSIGKNGKSPVVTLEDSKFLFEMHERTDITVISRGLLNMSKIDSSMWSLGYLRKCVGREFYHKFRRFDRTLDENGFEVHTERDNLYSMRFEDYVEYCEKRGSYMEEKSKDISSSSNTDEPTFTFEDHLGRTHNVSVGTSALYMIDLDMKRLTPLLNGNFLECFELPAVLPGGSHCMMNSVTPDARPFMGPNLYVTPPASFTHFHQDGHGTVDSGHLCISGFNEVVMLRRLTERHKKHALWILSGKKPGGSHFDGLYSMPHGDGLGEKPAWPTTVRIEECKRMGYCPSIFTLEPGDLVHINKGRLHAFRKMSTSKLPEWDCHVKLRHDLIELKGIAGEEKLCVSVAWDWMYRGVTPAGINREVSTVLEGSTLNRKNDVTSLAIPELALLQMAKSIPARSLPSSRGNSFICALARKEKQESCYESRREEICRGIYPGLSIIVGQHICALNVEESMSTEKGERLSIAKIPDTQENPQTCPLDPYGDSDFECKLCRKELSNVYFHCDGCEKLLSKDFNICRGCYLKGKFKIKVQMHPSNPKRHATLNHMGDNRFNRQSRCPCKNGPACNYCGFCLGCSCRCHTWFTMRTRLCNAADEEKCLQAVKDTAAFQSAVHTTRQFELEERTRHLRDRLKYAGDDELLNEDKKNDTELNGDIGKLSNDDKKDLTEANECDEKSPSLIQEDNREGNKEDEKKILTKWKEKNVIAKEDDGQEVTIYDKKDRVPLNEIGDDEAILI